jgi:DNA-binding MarR family transcriptional regulator
LTIQLPRCIVNDMDAIELIDLGRRLTKIGEEAMRGKRGPGMPAGRALVLRDVFANPGCSVNDIVARIGLPQGYVSECIAKLREDEMVETTTDPSDRRRTLVNFGRRHAARVLAAGAAPVDDTLASALGEEDREALAEVLNVLSSLARRLRPRAERPVARGLTPRPGPKRAR